MEKRWPRAGGRCISYGHFFSNHIPLTHAPALAVGIMDEGREQRERTGWWDERHSNSLSFLTLRPFVSAPSIDQEMVIRTREGRNGVGCVYRWLHVHPFPAVPPVTWSREWEMEGPLHSWLPQMLFLFFSPINVRIIPEEARPPNNLSIWYLSLFPSFGPIFHHSI